tara:strand:- start:631 stop:945 length:315 start_codon:yes stop_codon:yes gene_type:complete
LNVETISSVIYFVPSSNSNSDVQIAQPESIKTKTKVSIAKPVKRGITKKDLVPLHAINAKLGCTQTWWAGQLASIARMASTKMERKNSIVFWQRPALLVLCPIN